MIQNLPIALELYNEQYGLEVALTSIAAICIEDSVVANPHGV